MGGGPCVIIIGDTGNRLTAALNAINYDAQNPGVIPAQDMADLEAAITALPASTEWETFDATLKTVQNSIPT